MSIPKRQEIREALKADLIDKTDCADKVYTNRVSALWKSEYPCISIFMNDESATPKNMSGKQYIRTATLVLQIVNEVSEGLDDSLDVIANQVEAAIEANQSITGTVQSCLLQNTEIELSQDTTTNLGSLTLIYQIQYIK